MLHTSIIYLVNQGELLESIWQAVWLRVLFWLSNSVVSWLEERKSEILKTPDKVGAVWLTCPHFNVPWRSEALPWVWQTSNLATRGCCPYFGTSVCSIIGNSHSSASWEKSRPGLEEEQRRNYPSHGTVDRLFTLAGLVEDFLNT